MRPRRGCRAICRICIAQRASDRRSKDRRFESALCRQVRHLPPDLAEGRCSSRYPALQSATPNSALVTRLLPRTSPSFEAGEAPAPEIDRARVATGRGRHVLGSRQAAVSNGARAAVAPRSHPRRGLQSAPSRPEVTPSGQIQSRGLSLRRIDLACDECLDRVDCAGSTEQLVETLSCLDPRSCASSISSRRCHSSLRFFIGRS